MPDIDTDPDVPVLSTVTVEPIESVELKTPTNGELDTEVAPKTPVKDVFGSTSFDKVLDKEEKDDEPISTMSADKQADVVREFDPLAPTEEMGKNGEVDTPADVTAVGNKSEIKTEIDVSNVTTPHSNHISPPSSPPPPPPPKFSATTDQEAKSPPSPLTINPFATLSSVFRKLPPFSPTHSRRPSNPPTPPSHDPSTPGAPIKDKGKEKGKEEDEPKFDYQVFLEKMRDRRADGVGKYLRSFLKHFQSKPPRTIADQIKVINDFLDFIALKMRENDLFYPTNVSQKRAEAEFEINLEAMEKLVLNRLWHLTFTPMLSQSGSARPPSDDLERDHVLTQRIHLFKWIEPKHLDLPFPKVNSPTSPLPPEEEPSEKEKIQDQDDQGEKADEEEEEEDDDAGAWDHYIPFAVRELANINHYKAPRDKIICILNCCKVIFGLIKQTMSNSETGADAFIPLLIYVVLKANPEHLVSNVQFVLRFRNPEKLVGETGYYLSSLNAAISFIETLDWSNLSNITQDEFERNVEEAITTLPPEFKSAFPLATPGVLTDANQTNNHHITSLPQVIASPPPATPPPTIHLPTTAPQRTPEPSSNIIPTLPISIPPILPTLRKMASQSDLLSTSPSNTAELTSPQQLFPNTAQVEAQARAFFQRGTEVAQRTVSRPLMAVGKIFEDLTRRTESTISDESDEENGRDDGPTSPLHKHGHGQRVRRGYAQGEEGMYLPDRMSDDEAEERIRNAHSRKHDAALGTLRAMFPDAEEEVVEMVLLGNGGDLGKTIDHLLDMT